MEKKEIEKLLDECGVKYVKTSTNAAPFSEEELEEFRNTLSKTNFIDNIDQRKC